MPRIEKELFAGNLNTVNIQLKSYGVDVSIPVNDADAGDFFLACLVAYKTVGYLNEVDINITGGASTTNVGWNADGCYRFEGDDPIPTTHLGGWVEEGQLVVKDFGSHYVVQRKHRDGTFAGGEVVYKEEA